MRVLILGVLTITACRSDEKEATTGGQDSSWWEELDDGDGDTDKPDDTGKPDDDDTGKPTGDKEACGDEVVAGAACEGDWTTTLCTDAAGEMWWCEDGTWTNEK